MKYFIVLLLTVCMCPDTFGQKATFIRVFDSNHHKTHKGKLFFVGDSSLTIIKHKSTVVIPVSEIAKIKLRRSMGHTVGISAGTLVVMGIITGAATAEPDAWILPSTPGESAAAGAAVGAVLGSAIGLLIAAPRSRPVFIINNNLENWLKIKAQLQRFAHPL